MYRDSVGPYESKSFHLVFSRDDPIQQVWEGRTRTYITQSTQSMLGALRLKIPKSFDVWRPMRYSNGNRRLMHRGSDPLQREKCPKCSLLSQRHKYLTNLIETHTQRHHQHESLTHTHTIQIIPTGGIEFLHRATVILSHYIMLQGFPEVLRQSLWKYAIQVKPSQKTEHAHTHHPPCDVVCFPMPIPRDSFSIGTSVQRRDNPKEEVLIL